MVFLKQTAELLDIDWLTKATKEWVKGTCFQLITLKKRRQQYSDMITIALWDGWIR